MLKKSLVAVFAPRRPLAALSACSSTPGTRACLRLARNHLDHEAHRPGLLKHVLRAAVGAATGALSSAFADVGIDDDFIAEVRQKVGPGTSALFAMTQDAVVDRVVQRFASTSAELVSTNLSAEQEARLRAAFAHAEAHERV